MCKGSLRETYDSKSDLSSSVDPGRIPIIHDPRHMDGRIDDWYIMYVFRNMDVCELFHSRIAMT